MFTVVFFALCRGSDVNCCICCVVSTVLFFVLCRGSNINCCICCVVSWF